MSLSRRLLACALLSVAAALPSRALAQEAGSDAGVTSAPTAGLTHRAHAAAYTGAKSEMVLGFYVNALREVDAHAQTFRADLFYWLRYKRRSPGLVDEELEEIRFVNGDVESQELEERKALDDFNYVLFRVRAQFHFHADFRRYPFDVQELPIEVQHGFLRADQLHVTPDRFSYDRSARPESLRGLGEGIDLMEMHVTNVRNE
jgi:hypothetical protein